MLMRGQSFGEVPPTVYQSKFAVLLRMRLFLAFLELFVVHL